MRRGLKSKGAQRKENCKIFLQLSIELDTTSFAASIPFLVLVATNAEMVGNADVPLGGLFKLQGDVWLPLGRERKKKEEEGVLTAIEECWGKILYANTTYIMNISPV